MQHAFSVHNLLLETQCALANTVCVSIKHVNDAIKSTLIIYLDKTTRVLAHLGLSCAGVQFRPFCLLMCANNICSFM